MVYNKATYTGFINSSASDIATCTDPLQFCIEAAKSDHKLFEALITVDMTEAASKNGIINLSESDLSYMVETATNGIMDKIKNLVTKFKEMMASLFSKFSTFVSNLVSNDEKLYAKYKDYVVPAKIKGCDIKGNTVNTAKYNEVYEIVNRMISNANKLASVEITKLADASADVIEGLNKDYDTLKEIDIVNKEDKTIVEKVDLTEMHNTIKTGYKKQIDHLNSEKSIVEGMIRVMQTSVKAIERQTSDKELAGKLNSSYESLSRILSITSKAMSAATSIAKTAIAIYRGNFIKLGNWAMNKGGSGSSSEEKKPEETAKQEAFNMLIDIANESFCESTWEEAV